MATTSFGADVLVQVVDSERKPVADFSFTIQPSTSRDDRDSRICQTDENGERRLIGAVSFINSCVRVTIACAKDNHYYILDASHNIILPVQPGASRTVKTDH